MRYQQIGKICAEIAELETRKLALEIELRSLIQEEIRPVAEPNTEPTNGESSSNGNTNGATNHTPYRSHPFKGTTIGDLEAKALELLQNNPHIEPTHFARGLYGVANAKTKARAYQVRYALRRKGLI